MLVPALVHQLYATDVDFKYKKYFRKENQMNKYIGSKEKHWNRLGARQLCRTEKQGHVSVVLSRHGQDESIATIFLTLPLNFCLCIILHKTDS